MTTARLVLLHGVGLDHTMWQSVLAQLPPGTATWAPDLLGHGSSPAAADGTTLADLAAPVVDRLQPGDHLVGFSLGALVAQHIARRHPHLVASLTSVSSVCRRTDDERAAVLGRLRAAAEDFPASVEAALERWYAGTAVRPELVAETRATLLGNDVASYLNCYRVFAAADAELAPELSHIRVPGLAVTGASDPGSTPEMSRRLADSIPGCQVVVVPGARHMLPVQMPRELVEVLTVVLGDTAYV